MAAVLLLHLLVSISLFPATSTPPRPAPTNCSDELVAFSVCLPYISSHPNNQTHSPSTRCCRTIASSFASPTVICFCYFIQQPLILGFPLNSTRLMSLARLCSRANNCRNRTAFSLKSLCAQLPKLPPLRSITGPDGQPTQWTPGGEDLLGSPEQNSGPVDLSPPSPYPWATNNTKPAEPVPAPATGNIAKEPGQVPTAASTNTTKEPGPVTTSGDDYYYDHEPGNTAATFARCSSRWGCFIPQIIIFALLSSCF